MRVALRTQQVIAHETGVTNTIDPLGGSYFVESLTDRMEQLAYEYFAKIDELGGMVEAVKRGYPQREIADAAFELQREYDSGERKLVGVNSYTEGGEGEIEILRIDPALERKQIDRVQGVRARRDGATVEAALAELKAAAAQDDAQPDAEPPRLRARTRHRGRDRRGPPDGLRHLHRDPRLLAPKGPASMRKLLVVTLVAALSAVLAVPGARRRRASVKVGDDYYVRKGSVADRDGQEGHEGDVALGRQGHAQRLRHQGPGEVPLRRSRPRAPTRKRVKRTGTYTIVCTIHQPDMTMKLRVTR